MGISDIRKIIAIVDKFDDKVVEGLKAVRDILNIVIDIFDDE